MSAAEASTATLLGLSSRQAGGSLLALSAEVARGVPVAALDRVVARIAPEDAGFAHRVVPRATLARRRVARPARLGPEESARVARLAEIWTQARSVWGSDGEARAFLFRAHPLLGGRPPMDVVLESEFGRLAVAEILGRLQHGSAA
jgi:putative toxin-antitoxin system antitoxin component (TIGR02293 family)